MSMDEYRVTLRIRDTDGDTVKVHIHTTTCMYAQDSKGRFFSAPMQWHMNMTRGIHVEYGQRDGCLVIIVHGIIETTLGNQLWECVLNENKIWTVLNRGVVNEST